ncbi:MAG: hypothetical protein WC453_03215 [Patescibacteria group bacterium]
MKKIQIVTIGSCQDPASLTPSEMGKLNNILNSQKLWPLPKIVVGGNGERFEQAARQWLNRPITLVNDICALWLDTIHVEIKPTRKLKEYELDSLGLPMALCDFIDTLPDHSLIILEHPAILLNDSTIVTSDGLLIELEIPDYMYGARTDEEKGSYTILVANQTAAKVA